MTEPVYCITLRMPASLKPKLETMARGERRSLTNQIVTLLEKGVASATRSMEAGVPAAGEASQA